MKVSLTHNSVGSALFKNPHTQYIFNIWFIWFWLVNSVLVGVIYYVFPRYYMVHERFFVFYLIEVSIFSLIISHFTAVISSEAAINTSSVEIDKAENVTIET